jgi:hypothetical protein
MSTTWEGIKKSKPNLILDGNKVIVKNVVIYHFDNEDSAKEYYYKMR